MAPPSEQTAPTPIYETLVREWSLSGRAVPRQGAGAGGGGEDGDAGRRRSAAEASWSYATTEAALPPPVFTPAPRRVEWDFAYEASHTRVPADAARERTGPHISGYGDGFTDPDGAGHDGPYGWHATGEAWASTPPTGHGASGAPQGQGESAESHGGAPGAGEESSWEGNGSTDAGGGGVAEVSCEEGGGTREAASGAPRHASVQAVPEKDARKQPGWERVGVL